MLKGNEERAVENLALTGQIVVDEAEQAMQNLDSAVWDFVADETEQDIFIKHPELLTRENINSVSKDGKFPGQTVFWRLCAFGQHILTKRRELLYWGDSNATPTDGPLKGKSALFCMASRHEGTKLLKIYPDLLVKGSPDDGPREGPDAGKTVLWQLARYFETALLEMNPEFLLKGNLNAMSLEGKYRGCNVVWLLTNDLNGRGLLERHPELLKNAYLDAALKESTPTAKRGTTALWNLATYSSPILERYPELLTEGNLDAAPLEGNGAGKTVLWQLAENKLDVLSKHSELLILCNMDTMALEGVDKGKTIFWQLARDPIGRSILAQNPELLETGRLDAAPEQGPHRGKTVLWWLASTPDGRAILAANPEILDRANVGEDSEEERAIKNALELTEEGRAIMQGRMLHKDWLKEAIDCLKRAEDVATEIKAAQTSEVTSTRRGFFSKSEKISQAKVEEIIAQKSALEKQYLDLVGKLSNIRLGIMSMSKTTDDATAEKEKSNFELRQVLTQVKQLEKEVLELKEAKERAEEEMEFWGKHLNGVRQELHNSVTAHHDVKTELALRSAELKRNAEDLIRLNADIVELAELAEQLQDDKEKHYTESQYGYMRRKCDELQKGRDELLKRAYAAEKEAGQAVLEVEFKDANYRLQVEKLQENISDLNQKIRKLQGECATLKSGDRIVEIEELKGQLAKERARTFSTVLDSFDSAAAAGVVALQKKNDEQQAKIQELEAKLNAQEALPLSPQLIESKLAKNMKRVAIGAGLILAAVATVAALGFLGLVAVTYALPLLAIGFVIAAGGTAIAHLTQSKHKDRMALEAITSENIKPGLIERTVLTVKSTMEKAVSETAQTVTPV